MTWHRAVEVGFGAALLMLASIGWVSYRNTATSIEIARQVAQSHAVLAGSEAVVSAINEAEAAQRAYVITGEERHLAPVATVIAAIDQGLERLRQLTSQNPNQQQRISLLKPLIDEKIAQLQHSIDVQRAEGFQPVVQVALTSQGKALTDQIRWVIETMKGEERALILRQDELLKSRARITYATIFLGIGLCVVLLSLVVYLFMREVAERIRVDDAWRQAK